MTLKGYSWLCAQKSLLALGTLWDAGEVGKLNRDLSWILCMQGKTPYC